MMKWMASPGSPDRAASQAMTLSGWHFTAVVGTMVLFSFVSTFMFARERATVAKNEALKEWNRRLELRAAAVTPNAEPTSKAGLAEAQVREIEAKARAEYDRSINAITTELQQLYEMESKARSITGMAPRKVKPTEVSVAATDGGKGGGLGIAPVASLGGTSPVMRPPHVIYGMARPTADLILQEIRIRRSSLGDLVKSMEAEKDRVSRMPQHLAALRRRGRNHLALRLSRRSDQQPHPLPRGHRHLGPGRDQDSCDCPGQGGILRLGRILRQSGQGGPWQWRGDVVRPHVGPRCGDGGGGGSRAAYWACRFHGAIDRQPPALRGACEREVGRRREVSGLVAAPGGRLGNLGGPARGSECGNRTDWKC